MACSCLCSLALKSVCAVCLRRRHSERWVHWRVLSKPCAAGTCSCVVCSVATIPFFASKRTSLVHVTSENNFERCFLCAAR